MLTTHLLRGVPGAAAVLMTILACGTTPAPADAIPTGLPSSGPSAAPADATPLPMTGVPTATQAAAPSNRVFTVAVIVDLQSETVRRDQAQAVIGEASRFLRPLTSFDLVMTDFVEDGGGGSTNEIAGRYVSSHAGALPNGLVVFSFGDAGQAKLLGGYSFTLAGSEGFRNAFSSPVTGSGHIYVAVVHFGHKYAACGYGGSDAVQSKTSLDGECRNQPGTACVQHNGFSMCSDSVAHLYASTPTYFVSSTIVHELLHSFSPGGDRDHYSTAECNTRMGYPAEFFDLQEAQYHNGLCPYVYEDFVNSYQP